MNHFSFSVLFSLALHFLAGSAAAQSWKTYPYHEAGSVLNFPQDEGAHPGEPVEWWYTNARVTGLETGTEYSFMLTYFHYPVLGFDGFRILNFANEDTGEFYDETQPANYPTLAEDHLEIRASVGLLGLGSESWVTKEGAQGQLVPFEYHISSAGAHGAIELDYTALKPPLMVGGTGFLNQGVNNYTYYYSQTAVEVTGTLTFQGLTEPVSGIAWIDRQYGDFNPNTGEPYEWFSLQLDNGMDINLWNIFTFDDQIPDTVTYRIFSAYVNDSTSVTSSVFGLERLGYAWMPDNEVCYAQQWRFTSAALDADLIMATLHSDQEVALPFRFYEGTMAIEGTVGGQPVSGRGFAELLHQYEHPALEILSPVAGQPWDPAVQPIRWQLLNPDDGRPVTYDISLSFDDKVTWTTLAEGLPATEYLWDATGWPADSLYWLRISGYSIDGTLMGSAETDIPYAIVTGTDGFPVAQTDFRAFPNPASRSVFISLDGWEAEMTARLYDAAGRRRMEASGRGQIEWDVSGLPPGLYWVEVIRDGRLQTMKLAIAR
ncbi:MAG: T9SS type A sorting domain-containing protein [Phaeodactylibacter sp.]|nr:T9SS type A sorting domain-containing protein [Phaeodactylibacter sp.]